MAPYSFDVSAPPGTYTLLVRQSDPSGGEGPGLYVMRTDGLRPKRISSLLGDSLRWEALPPAPTASPASADGAKTVAPGAPAAKPSGRFSPACRAAAARRP